MQLSQNNMTSDSSSSPDGRTTQTQTKTKQERIRDNQRRSRARRQEYLAELERKLLELQSAYRELSLQHEHWVESQIRETRLRELCVLAGYNDQLIEQYLSQNRYRYAQEPNSALRTLKPKLEPVDSNKRLMSNAMSQSMMSQSASRRPSAIMSVASSGNPDRTTASTPASMYGPLTPASALPISPLGQVNASGFDWGYATQQAVPQHHVQDQEYYIGQAYTQPQQPNMSDSFGCEAFGFPVTSEKDDLSAPGTMSKQMIDSYNMPATDLEHVENMLSHGNFSPTQQGTGYNVNNEAMYQVLNKLGNYSLPQNDG